MTERVDIANLALTLLGADPIDSLDDTDNKSARIMKIQYGPARDATTEAHEWSFATKRFIPSPVTESPLWGYEYRHLIPGEILRVTQVEHPWADNAVFTNRAGDERKRNQVDHVVEAGYILSDVENIQCVGLEKVTEEGRFSPLFVHAFAVKLALFSCYALTESNSKFEKMAQLYKGAMDEAKSRDGMQSSTRRMRNDSMRRVR